jgi:putative DNA primase/helicase
MTHPVLAAARSYAARGWPVLPLRPGKKSPAIQRGFHAASVEPGFVEREFANQYRGVGTRTGNDAGFFALDIDPQNGGDASFEALIRLHGPLPVTLTVSTGGGGLHYYFRTPLGGSVPCRTALSGYPGVDIKGEGGYVVAPPSKHPSGGYYTWSTTQGADVPISEAPDWLVGLIFDQRSGSKRRDPQENLNLHAPEGTRNLTVFRLACKLRDAGLPQDSVSVMAYAANAGFSPPLDESEVLQIVSNAFTRGPADALPLTDMANARRLVDRAAGDYRYDPVGKRWLVWDGKVWSADQDGAVIRLARSVAQDLEDSASEVSDPSDRAKLLAAARRQQNAARLHAMVELARTEPESPVFANKLDAHPYLLNAANGVVNLRTGELTPHDRGLLLTKMVPFAYDPQASCPRFLDFLSQVFEGDAQLVSYLQRLCGYVTTGDASEQVFFIFVGAGANGKSTLLNALSWVLDRYASHTPSETLVAQKMGRSSSNDLARLNGMRLVTASEFNPGEKLATGLIKQLTGNEKITARFLFREHDEFVPTFKLVLATNDIPHMEAADDALFRRVIPVPFNRVFARDEQDRTLSDKLKDEAEGILAWMVKGAVDWCHGGLQTPHSILSILEGIRRDMDPVAQFLDDACELGAPFEVSSGDLLAVYVAWAQRHGLPHFDTRGFGKIIAKKGFKSRKSNGRMVLQGLRLRAEHQIINHLTGDAA